MQDPSASLDIATPRFSWLRAFVLVAALCASGIALVAIATGGEGEISCGGG